jgi:uncharacterized repeat protein (TIGR02543 family)
MKNKAALQALVAIFTLQILCGFFLACANPYEPELRGLRLDYGNLVLDLDEDVSTAATLRVIAVPSSAELPSEIKWRSSDDKVATVQNGYVTAKKPEPALIYAYSPVYDDAEKEIPLLNNNGSVNSQYSQSSLFAACFINVVRINMRKNLYLKDGDTDSKLLEVTVKPEQGLHVTWSCDNPGVATVNTSGNPVTVRTTKDVEGDATVTATITIGSTTFYRNCVIKVSHAGAGQSYNVTFDKNHTDTAGYIDADPKTKQGNPNGVITLPTPPQRSGWTFLGWNTKADGKGARFDETTPVDAALTVYAQWETGGESLLYTVTFDTQGGTPATATKTVISGLPVEQPTGITKDGFDLEGWYKEDTLTNNWDFSVETVTSNVTLYAKWTAKTSKVTIEITWSDQHDAFIAPPSTSVNAGDPVEINAVLPQDPPPNNYSIVEWRVNGESKNGTSNKFDFTSWDKGTHTVTLVVSRGGKVYNTNISIVVQ